MTRPSVDSTMMLIAHTMASRSTCERGKVGAVIVSGRRIISTGYNGAPPGQAHCTDPDVGCELGDDGGCHRTVHAEANALAWAARSGIATESATMYCTHRPCYACAKLMLSAGIAKVVYNKPYRDGRGEAVLLNSGVPCIFHRGYLPDDETSSDPPRDLQQTRELRLPRGSG